MKDLRDAVVVIPFYKAELSVYERISLQQCFKVLNAYSIIAVKPGSLNFTGFSDFPFAEVIDFNNDYFDDIHGYNRLMLSAEFYEKFLNYKYLLIYQLDAFAFTDQLTQWCAKGYDYIGAPWIREQEYKGVFDQIKSEFKRWYYFRYNIKYKDGLPKIGKQLQDRAGNGGFSLRRVKLFHEYCNTYRDKINEYLQMRHLWFSEDIFWSIELNRKKQLVKIPSVNDALQFAFETHPERALKLNNNKLPFGCHAWDKHADFWRPYFEQRGYSI